MQTEFTNNPASLEQPTDPNPATQATGVDLEQVKKTVSDHLSRMLRFRRPYDPVRYKWFRQYVSNRDQKFFPDGTTARANTFVPYGLSNVETIVSRIHDAFFSVRPFFECNGRGAQDEAAAELMQVVLETKLHQAKLPQSIEKLTRNIAIYGHGGMKIDWDWTFEVVTFPQQVPITMPVIDPQTKQPRLDPSGQPLQAPVPDPMTGQPMTRIVMQTKTIPCKRPKFYVIDPYDLLVDPDGGMVAMCVEKTFSQIMQEVQGAQMQGQQLYFPEGLAQLQAKISQEKDPDTVIIRMAEFWNEFDNTWTLITFGEDRDALGWKDQRYAARTGSAYTPYKRRMYVGEPILLYHGTNPFAHRRCPIVHTGYVKMPHEPYGIGVIECMSDLNEALNQMVSMIRDNWNVGINQRYLYDATLDIDHEALNGANVPGGKVGVSGDPTKALFPLPHFTPNGGDYQLLDLYKGMIELTTGISDFYSKGVGSSGPNDTATGISSIINESNYRFKLFIRNMELDIIQPLLEMSAANIQQFLTDAEEVMITEEMPGIPKWSTVPPEKLLGSLEFDVIAANYATNEVVRQRNMMALASLFEQNPYINQYEATKLMLKTFKIPEYVQLLKSPQQVQIEQAQAAQMQLQQQMLEFKMEMAKLEMSGNIKAATTAENKITGGGKEGRPRSPMQPEGKIPGAGNTSATRNQAQNMGANALGLSGMGEVGAG